MSHAYLTNVPLDEAVREYLAFLAARGMGPQPERVAVQDALDRITAEAVYARLCAPHYNAAAMDGIALDARLSFGATETTPVYLQPGQFVPVDTGDPLPEGCDAVIMIEDVVALPDGAIRLNAAAAPWQHVRQIGEDVSAGDMLLPACTRITPAAMGAMLAGGVSHLLVSRRPVIGLIPTGDEIVPPSDHPAPGEVMEFNSTIFSGLLTQWGARTRVYPIVPDDPGQLRAALGQAAADCDAVLLLAGTSAGRDDHTTAIVRELGEILYHGLAIRPGKPAALGAINAVPVLGVPGYPVSGILVLEYVFRPVVEALLGAPPACAEIADVCLTRRVHSPLKYREFLRARLGCAADGSLLATPESRGAGVVSAFVRADCLLDIPQDTELIEPGETVQAILLRPLSEIRRTLNILGSHDPLLDEAADLLHRSCRSAFVSSAHVGSMGAVMAVKRGEAPMGGVHLLDPATGTYNAAIVKTHFPNGGAALIECVQRVQGLMVAKGNPKRIRGFADAARPELSYVNRQRGAGTRVLCDHLLQQNGLMPDQVRGYGRKEATHTAVAAQIAAGAGDLGLGILSAARMYDLDFLPVCLEQYDLLVREDALESPLVQAFLEVLASPAFAARLERMGGYTIEHPGRRRSL